MIINYFKTACRNIWRNKGFSTINIAGLALGICCSLLILLWVQDERKIDAFHANGKYLYQVFERRYADGKIDASYPTQGLLARELQRVIPEIEYASGFEYASMPGTLNTFEAEHKISKMGGSFADADFFKMFSYPLVAGNSETALSVPGGIVISRRMAEMFFGSAEKAIGKSIRYENKEDLQVTAVFENHPRYSSQQFDFLRSWIDFVAQNPWVHNWGNTSPATFVQLRPDADREKVQQKIKDFIYRYQPKEKGALVELGLQPYSEKYLHSSFKNGQVEGGRIEYVRLFTMVAAFILLIACVNFMNLATARSAKRAKEVGVRKVIGASRQALIRQFIGEAVLLVFVSTVIAFFLALGMLPVFNDLTGKQLSLPVSEPVFWLALLGLILVTGFVAGSYPALYLSSLNATKVLKGRLRFGWPVIFFRKALVVFQFALSLILIVATIIIYRQVKYVHSANLGYDRDNLVYIPIEGELIKNYTLFKEQALKVPGVLNISKMRNSPTIIEHHTGSIEWPGKNPNLNVSFADAVVGYDFVKTLDIKLTQGRDFAQSFGTDSASYLLNETAVQKIGFTDPVGKTVFWGNRRGTVIGVLKDFHFHRGMPSCLRATYPFAYLLYAFPFFRPYPAVSLIYFSVFLFYQTFRTISP